jgi:hypothetical protein
MKGKKGSKKTCANIAEVISKDFFPKHVQYVENQRIIK